MIPREKSRFFKRLRGFRKDTSGTASIESLIWIPIFVFILVLIADASFIFHGRTQALRILQDSNRAYSVGRFSTTGEVKAAALDEISKYTSNATVETTVSSGIITSTMTFPATDLMAIGKLDALKNITVTVVSKQYVES